MQIRWCCLLWLWSNKTNKMATEPPHRRRCSLRENKKWDKKLWHCWFPSRYVPIYSITVFYAFLHRKANFRPEILKFFFIQCRYSMASQWTQEMCFWARSFKGVDHWLASLDWSDPWARASLVLCVQWATKTPGGRAKTNQEFAQEDPWQRCSCFKIEQRIGWLET